MEKLMLIEGVFSAAEAREVLTNILNSKINFHQRKNFSSQERDGREDEIAIRRIPELNKSLGKVELLTKEAVVKGKKIRIRSEIFVHYLEDEAIG